MNGDLIYLDYAATTPTDPRVAEHLLDCRQTRFANPSSNHIAGRESRASIEHAASQLAALLHADPNTLIWTSGAT